MPNEFLKKVKAKYPAYAEIPDDSLASLLLKKFPQYGEHLSEYAAPADASKPLPATSTEGSDSYGAQLVSNIPESAGKFIGNIANVVTHPVETAKGVGGLLGDLGKVYIGTTNPTETPYLGAILKDLAQRYGGWENIANTFRDDPVGVAGDASLLAGGTGAALKAAGEGGKIGEIGNVVGKVGAAIDPIGGPIGLAKKVTPLESGSRRLYRSAVKPSTSLAPAQREAIVTTGLAEKVVPTEAGYTKMQDLIADLNKQVLAQTEEAAKRGVAVDANAVVSKIDEVEDYFKRDVDPKPHLRDLENLRKRFIAAHGKTIPVNEAQKMKQATGAILRKTYGEMKPAFVEGKKALVRGLKDEIAAAVPEVQALNARESALLQLEPQIERAIGRIENLNLMSLTAPMTGAVFAASGKSTSLGFKAWILREIIDSPRFKARLAIAMDQAKKRGFQPSKITPAATLGRNVQPEEE